MEELEIYMEDLWTMSFRALDDIKESVRKAGFLTCKTLANVTIRYCDPIQVNPVKGQRIMDIIIPYLLDKGLPSMSEEVRTFSLSALLKLLKTGGVLLTYHVSNLTVTLIESLSSLEPSMMNYLSFHTDKYNITADQLDQTRLAAAKSSPVLEAIECIIPAINGNVLSDLVPKLCVIIHKGVGLPTKAGCARFVYLLVSRFPLEMRAYADQILKALSESLNDRSAVVRKSFSTALGYVARLASHTALDVLLKQLKEVFLKSEDDESKASIGISLLELTRNAPDAMKEHQDIIIPLAFIGARGTSDPQASKIWQELWDENTAGNYQAIRTWTPQLLQELKAIMKTTLSWNMKKQIGKSITDISKAQGESIAKYAEELLDLLKGELFGRTFDGKEAILEVTK